MTDFYIFLVDICMESASFLRYNINESAALPLLLGGAEMRPFSENRPFIEHEFETAAFDAATGLSADELYRTLKQMSDVPSEEPRPIVCAKAFAYLLDNAQMEINEHTPFAVKLNFGVDYTDFATATVFARAFEEQARRVCVEKLPEEYAKYRLFEAASFDWIQVDFTHTVPNWPYLLEHGFSGILANARASREKFLKNGAEARDEIAFLDSVILCYEAILRLLERIYAYSLSFDVPEFSACIKGLVTHAPETLYEVMMFSVLYLYVEEVGRERGRTLGPIDVMYLPYYQRDLQKGLTEEAHRELWRYYFMHFTAAKRFAQQPFTMCGSDKDGNDLTTPLSHLILEVYDELAILDPKIHVRCHAHMDERIFIKVLDMIRRGHNSICLINDEAVYRGYERLGIPREDAQHYVILGCYEPIIMGMEEAEIAALRFNTTKCVELAINGGKDLLTGAQVGFESEAAPASFEEFFEIYLQQLGYCTDFALEFIEKQGRYSTLINPSPIYSSSFAECIEQGRDVHEYPLKYNNVSLKHHGLATTVDSLMAIKKYVYDRKLISLSDMRAAMAKDWRGYEALRTQILCDREKYGNNLQAPDKIATDILNYLADRYCGKPLERGGKVRLGLDSVYHCIRHGEKTAATPDGRRAGRPLSKNLCASDGMDRGGITAYMQSVLKIDADAFVDGVPFDFILHPSAVEGAKGLDDFASLMKIFFKHGGFAAQGNVISGKMLIDAQQNPEKYATLQVRVCGWNEYFVKLSRTKQDMFIKQCEVPG
ncbi:MAG: hypothetical protein E7644_02465 [Ruminococcaceae bacterium]|nr:hypothetical protein [Oscillospiraceae bacterium]